MSENPHPPVPKEITKDTSEDEEANPVEQEDDEKTIEREEKMEPVGLVGQEELNQLEAEQDLPIEEIMRRYKESADKEGVDPEAEVSSDDEAVSSDYTDESSEEDFSEPSSSEESSSSSEDDRRKKKKPAVVKKRKVEVARKKKN